MCLSFLYDVPHTHNNAHLQPQVGDMEYGAQDFFGLVEEMRVWKVRGLCVY